MAIKVVALDLERTLISDAMNREPRPGLRAFLAFCTERCPRIALFTAVSKPQVDAVFADLARADLLPDGFLARLEYVVWRGSHKDLRFIKDAEAHEVLLIDDDGGWLLSEHQSQWIAIKEYDPYLVTGEDHEFARIQALLETYLD